MYFTCIIIRYLYTLPLNGNHREKIEEREKEMYTIKTIK